MRDAVSLTLTQRDLDVGILWVLALAGLMIIPLWMMGWASNNKYALLAGMRSVRSEERRVGKECRSRWSPYH